MLPRHVRSFLVAQRVRSLLRHPQSQTLRLCAQSRQFHASSHSRNELPKSPFQTFVEVLREELRKNRELQDNVKQLQGDVDKFQDSEAMKRARDVYERARVPLQCSSSGMPVLLNGCCFSS